MPKESKGKKDQPVIPVLLQVFGIDQGLKEVERAVEGTQKKLGNKKVKIAGAGDVDTRAIESLKGIGAGTTAVLRLGIDASQVTTLEKIKGALETIQTITKDPLFTSAGTGLDRLTTNIVGVPEKLQSTVAALEQLKNISGVGAGIDAKNFEKAISAVSKINETIRTINVSEQSVSDIKKLIEVVRPLGQFSSAISKIQAPGVMNLGNFKNDLSSLQTILKRIGTQSYTGIDAKVNDFLQAARALKSIKTIDIPSVSVGNLGNQMVYIKKLFENIRKLDTSGIIGKAEEVSVFSEKLSGVLPTLKKLSELGAVKIDIKARAGEISALANVANQAQQIGDASAGISNFISALKTADKFYPTNLVDGLDKLGTAFERFRRMGGTKENFTALSSMVNNYLRSQREMAKVELAKLGVVQEPEVKPTKDLKLPAWQQQWGDREAISKMFHGKQFAELADEDKKAMYKFMQYVNTTYAGDRFRNIFEKLNKGQLEALGATSVSEKNRLISIYKRLRGLEVEELLRAEQYAQLQWQKGLLELSGRNAGIAIAKARQEFTKSVKDAMNQKAIDAGVLPAPKIKHTGPKPIEWIDDWGDKDQLAQVVFNRTWGKLQYAEQKALAQYMQRVKSGINADFINSRASRIGQMMGNVNPSLDMADYRKYLMQTKDLENEEYVTADKLAQAKFGKTLRELSARKRKMIVAITRQELGKKLRDELLQAGRENAILPQQQMDSFGGKPGANTGIYGAAKRVVLWGSASFALYRGVYYMRQAITTAVEFENQMIQLKKVMDQSTDFAGLEKSLFKLSKTYGVAVGDMINIAKVWAQQGYATQQVLDLTNASIQAMLALNIDAATATDYLTSAVRVWDLQIQDISSNLSALMAVQAKYAIESEDLALIFTKIGAGVRAAGDDMAFLAGISTALRETTRKTAREIATISKASYARAFRPDTIATLEKIGIQTKINTNTFRPFNEILREVAAKWKDLSDVEQKSIAFAIGGIRYWSDFFAILENFEIAENAERTFLQSWDEASQAVKLQMGSMKNQLSSLTTTILQFSKLWADTAIAPVLQSTIVPGFKAIVGILQKAHELTGGLLVPLRALTLVLGIGGLMGAFKFFFGQSIQFERLKQNIGATSKEYRKMVISMREMGKLSVLTNIGNIFKNLGTRSLAVFDVMLGSIGKTLKFLRGGLSSVGKSFKDLASGPITLNRILAGTGNLFRKIGLNTLFAAGTANLAQKAFLRTAFATKVLAGSLLYLGRTFTKFLAIGLILEALFWAVDKVSGGIKKLLGINDELEFSDEALKKYQEFGKQTQAGLIAPDTMIKSLESIVPAITRMQSSLGSQKITWTDIDKVIDSMEPKVKEQLRAAYGDLEKSTESQAKFWHDINRLVAYYNNVTIKKTRDANQSLFEGMEKSGQQMVNSIEAVRYYTQKLSVDGKLTDDEFSNLRDSLRALEGNKHFKNIIPEKEFSRLKDLMIDINTNYAPKDKLIDFTKELPSAKELGNLLGEYSKEKISIPVEIGDDKKLRQTSNLRYISEAGERSGKEFTDGFKAGYEKSLVQTTLGDSLATIVDMDKPINALQDTLAAFTDLIVGLTKVDEVTLDYRSNLAKLNQEFHRTVEYTDTQYLTARADAHRAYIKEIIDTYATLQMQLEANGKAIDRAAEHIANFNPELVRSKKETESQAEYHKDIVASLKNEAVLQSLINAKKAEGADTEDDLVGVIDDLKDLQKLLEQTRDLGINFSIAEEELTKIETLNDELERLYDLANKRKSRDLFTQMRFDIDTESAEMVEKTNVEILKSTYDLSEEQFSLRKDLVAQYRLSASQILKIEEDRLSSQSELTLAEIRSEKELARVKARNDAAKKKVDTPVGSQERKLIDMELSTTIAQIDATEKLAVSEEARRLAHAKANARAKFDFDQNRKDILNVAETYRELGEVAVQTYSELRRASTDYSNDVQDQISQMQKTEIDHQLRLTEVTKNGWRNRIRLMKSNVLLDKEVKQRELINKYTQDNINLITAVQSEMAGVEGTEEDIARLWEKRKAKLDVDVESNRKLLQLALDHLDVITDMNYQMALRAEYNDLELKLLEEQKSKAEELRNIFSGALSDLEQIATTRGASIPRDIFGKIGGAIIKRQADDVAKKLIDQNLAQKIFGDSQDEQVWRARLIALEQESIQMAHLKGAAYIEEAIYRGMSGSEFSKSVTGIENTIGKLDLNSKFVKSSVDDFSRGVGIKAKLDLKRQAPVEAGVDVTQIGPKNNLGLSILSLLGPTATAAIMGSIRPDRTGDIATGQAIATGLLAAIPGVGPMAALGFGGILGGVAGGFFSDLFGKKEKDPVSDDMLTSLNMIERHTSRLEDIANNMINIPASFTIPPSTFEFNGNIVIDGAGIQGDPTAIAQQVLTEIDKQFNKSKKRTGVRGRMSNT